MAEVGRQPDDEAPRPGDQDRSALARALIDSNLYMTLGTADEAGQPWVSPVYYAPAGYTEFFWLSSPRARHSLNLAGRPQVSIVIFDSRVPVNHGQAVYMSANAKQVAETDVEAGLAVFSARSEAHGAGAWAVEDVQAPARLRLYRAVTTEHFVLDRDDQRIPVQLR